MGGIEPIRCAADEAKRSCAGLDPAFKEQLAKGVSPTNVAGQLAKEAARLASIGWRTLDKGSSFKEFKEAQANLSQQDEERAQADLLGAAKRYGEAGRLVLDLDAPQAHQYFQECLRHQLNARHPDAFVVQPGIDGGRPWGQVTPDGVLRGRWYGVITTAPGVHVFVDDKEIDEIRAACTCEALVSSVVRKIHVADK
jgi:hypothetical protein